MAETSSSDKLKVFISYSRRDSSDFAEELVAGLELAGFAPFLDRHDIALGEPWEDRLSGLIQHVDTVVYVISPEAVRSDRCQWEVDKTLALSKRLMPVVFKAVPEADIPEQLRRRQFVRFDTGPGITRPLAQLVEALRQDLDWIREHTRIGELAARWEARKRPQSLLLRGEDIAATQAWVERRKVDAPAISEVVRGFIRASTEAEATQLVKTSAIQRRIILMQALLSAALITVIIGLVGWINQSHIADQWRWWTVTRPYMVSQVRPYVLSEQAEQALKRRDLFRECTPRQQDQDYCPDMIVVPAGSFMMGSLPTEKNTWPNELPQHSVAIDRPFAVSKFQLTFAEWDACVTAGGCNGYKPSDVNFGRGAKPVINVSWEDAQQYVGWLSKVTGKPYRLLSEAEYEYATRAGTTTEYPWGDDIGKNNASCNDCGSPWDGVQTAPVGCFAGDGFVGCTFPANAFGLDGMVGNVFEWTEDCYHTNYNGAPADGSAWISGDCSNRSVRAGSWGNPPDNLRSASRSRVTADIRDLGLSFRVARTLDTR